MAIIETAASGNWATGGTWSGGVAPGNNDIGKIKPTHTVTVAADMQCLGIYMNGGAIAINANITFTDGAGAGITIDATQTNSITSNASATSPKTIVSASANPTNLWTWSIVTYTGYDARMLSFNYIECRGCKYYLGNSAYPIHLNGGGTNDPVLRDATPIERDVRLDEHEIRGRSTGRVYHRSLSAGASVISGICSWDSWMPLVVRDLEASKARISMMSRYVHIPLGRIERASFRPRGGLYIDFSITVREDI